MWCSKLEYFLMPCLFRNPLSIQPQASLFDQGSHHRERDMRRHSYNTACHFFGNVGFFSVISFHLACRCNCTCKLRCGLRCHCTGDPGVGGMRTCKRTCKLRIKIQAFRGTGNARFYSPHLGRAAGCPTRNCAVFLFLRSVLLPPPVSALWLFPSPP